MVDGLRKFDDAEVPLTFLGFAAGLTRLVSAAHAHVRVVEAALRGHPVAVELGVREFNNGPAVLKLASKRTISSLLSKVNLMLFIFASSAVEWRKCAPDCFI